MAQEERIKEVIKKGTKIVLIKLGVFRSDKGIEVVAESQFIENFFKKYGVNESEVKWADSLPYNYPEGFEDKYVQMFHYWKKSLFVGRSGSAENATPNLSFLRAVGLSNGKTFIITDTIYSAKEISRFKKIASEEIKNFYEQYMKSVNVSVEIVITLNDDTK